MLRPVLTLLVLLGVASCSSHRGPGAAEPATAPVPSRSPAGTVHRVGDSPEGIVFDPTTDTVAVAVRNPARLLLLDPATLRTRANVPLPGTVRHLQLAAPGGPVLVPDESAGELVEVALSDGHAVTATKVGKQPHDAAAVAGGAVVVGNEFGRSISFVADGRVLRTVTGPQQPGGIMGIGTTVGVVDVGGFSLSTYDVASGRKIAQVPAGAGPTHGVLVGGNRIAVADTRGGSLLLFSAAPLKRIGSLSMPGAPYGMAVDGDAVWVTLTARNEVVGLDVSGNTPRLIARYPTVRQPNTVAVAPGGHRIWVTGTDDGVVQLITR